MSRIVALVAVIAVVLAIAAIHDAAAGERCKGRTVWCDVKWEQVDVGGEEGHLVEVYESKGIDTIFEGKTLPDRAAARETGVIDINLNTGVGSGHGYFEMIDGDADNYHSDGMASHRGPVTVKANLSI